MSTRAARFFERELLKLFRARTHELRSYMWPISGGPPVLSKKKVTRSIQKLKNIAQEDYLKSKEARSILIDYAKKRQWHPKKGKGTGWLAKRRAFQEWYEQRITTRNCVYAFWRRSQCLYVGRTLNGKGRPTSHFEKHWFGQTTRIDIYGFDRKRDVPRYECMRTHQWGPSYPRNKPSKKRYSAHCPVCQGRRKIEDEVRRMFRLR
jgi:hypothetical protein